jgi:hypothetical protein
MPQGLKRGSKSVRQGQFNNQMTSLTESKAKQKVESSLKKHILSPDFNFRILSTDKTP